jgi:hypothetical protein
MGKKSRQLNRTFPDAVVMRIGIETEVRNQGGESALDVALGLGLLRIVERLKWRI